MVRVQRDQDVSQILVMAASGMRQTEHRRAPKEGKRERRGPLVPIILTGKPGPHKAGKGNICVL